jgi:hypothetical protein
MMLSQSSKFGANHLPYQDFRPFLDVLRQHGKLIDINRQGPAIMFNQNGTD